MKKSPSLKQLLFEQQVFGVLLFTLLAVSVWVLSSIYFSYTEYSIPDQEEAQVIPIDPGIDEKPLLQLQQRKWWTAEELQQFTPTVKLKQE